MRRYRVISADCPWTYNRFGQKGHGRVEGKYPTMPLEAIGALPVARLARDDGTALFMWATGPKLPQALWVMGRWGFEFKTVAFVWEKTYESGAQFFGMGSYTRSDAEFVLLGIRGGGLTKLRKSASVRETFFAPVGKHSEKPEVMYDRIEALLPGPYLELFARRERKGWDIFGNEPGVRYTEAVRRTLEGVAT